MKRKIIVVLGIFILLIGGLSGSTLAAMPPFNPDQGVIIKEIASGDILAEQNANERYYPASTTKLMTALTALDHVGKNLDGKVTVGEEITVFGYDSSIAHLEVGEVYTWEQLLYGLLLPSGNDAANTIAANIGRKISTSSKMDYNQAISVFMEAMNAKAKEMGLEGTNFVNPHGLHDPNHYTTPAELLKIGEAAANNTLLSKIEATKIYTMTTSTGKAQKWKNTNVLLYKDTAEYGETIEENNPGNPYYNIKSKGGKTGFTEEAGRCLVFNAADGTSKIVGVIMKVPEKPDKNLIFGQTNTAINASFDDNRLLTWTNDNGHYKEFDVRNTHYKDGNKLLVTTKEAFSSMIPKGTEDQYAVKVSWDANLIEDTDKGLKVIGDMSQEQQVGELTVYKGTEALKATPLYAENQVRAKNWIDHLRISLFIGIPVLILLLILGRIQRQRKKQKLRQKKDQEKRQARRRMSQNQRSRGAEPSPRRSNNNARPPQRPPQRNTSGKAQKPRPLRPDDPRNGQKKR